MHFTLFLFFCVCISVNMGDTTSLTAVLYQGFWEVLLEGKGCL